MKSSNPPKRLVSSLLTLLLLVQMLPPPLAFAVEEDSIGTDTTQAETETASEAAEESTGTETETEVSTEMETETESETEMETAAGTDTESETDTETNVDTATKEEAAPEPAPERFEPEALQPMAEESNAVARVNGTEYTSIDDAFAATTSGTVTVELLDNATASNTLTVPSGADIILNIPTSMTLSSTATLCAIKVEDGGKLTVTGCGTIITTASYCVEVYTGATFTVPEATTVTFESTATKGYGLDVESGATATLSGGTFKGTKAIYAKDRLGFTLAPGYTFQDDSDNWLACLNNAEPPETTTVVNVVKAPATATIKDPDLTKYCKTVPLSVTLTPEDAAVTTYNWYKKGGGKYLKIDTVPNYDLPVAEHNNSSVYCMVQGKDDWQVFSNVVKIAVPECDHADIDPDTGICNTCDTQMVASVTCDGATDYYATITEAFDAAAGKTATIKMFDNATLTETGLTVSAGDITLDMDDYTLEVYDGAGITVAGGTLTLKNAYFAYLDSPCVEVTSGHLNVYSGTISGAPAIRTVAGGTTLYGGTFRGVYDSNAIEVTGGGTVSSLLPTGQGYQLGYAVDGTPATDEQANAASLSGEITIIAGEDLVTNVTIPDGKTIAYGSQEALSPTFTLKEGISEDILTYQWYVKEEGDTEFFGVSEEKEIYPGMQSSGGTFTLRCDVTALGRTVQSNEATVTIVESAITFMAERMDSDNPEAPDTYEFGDTIYIETAVQATGEPATKSAIYASTLAETPTEPTTETPSMPMQIEVYEGEELLTSVAWQPMDQVDSAFICPVTLPAAMFKTGIQHTLTLKFTGYPGMLAASSQSATLTPFTVNPSACGNNHTVDPTTGDCTCGAHFDAMIGSTPYLTLDMAVNAAFSNNTDKEEATITLLPLSETVTMPFVSASPFTVPADKSLTITLAEGAQIYGIIAQITIAEGASLSLSVPMILPDLSVMMGDQSTAMELLKKSPALRVNGALTAKDSQIGGLVVGNTATKLDISGSTVMCISAQNGTLADIQALMPDCAFKDENGWLDSETLTAKSAEMLMVYPLPATIDIQASPDSVAFGYPTANAPVLTATATPSDASITAYQWCKADGTEISGATGATYAPTGLAVGDHAYYCKVTCTDADGDECTLRSPTTTVTVTPATLSIKGATLADKTYDGNTTATVNSVTFQDASGNEVSLTKDTDYTVEATYNTADAGTDKTATVTITLSNTNYSLAQNTYSLTGQTISPKSITPTIELSETSFTYNGAAQKPTVNVYEDANKTTRIGENEYTVTYTDSTSATVTEPTNVDTYTVTVTGKNNYSFSGSAMFAITAASLSDAIVTVNGSPFTYTGAVQQPADLTVTLGKQTLTAGTDYTITGYENNTNVGNATVKITGAGNYKDIASGTFKIIPATLTVDGTGIASGTYGAKLSELAVSGLTAKLNGTEIPGTWKLSGDTIPNVGDTGEYDATFTPSANANNYNPLTTKVKLNIAQATATPNSGTLSVENRLQKDYTFDLTKLLPVVQTGQELGTVSYALGNVDFIATDYYKTGVKIENTTLTLPIELVDSSDEGTIGTVQVIISSTNYQNMTATITVKTVNKTTVELTSESFPAKVYDGKPVEYTGKTTATKDGAPVTVKGFTKTWSTPDGTAPVNVGTYSLTISIVEDDPSYAGSTTIQVEIAKAPITITAPSRAIYTGDAVPTLTAEDCTIKGLIGTDPLKTPPTVSYDPTPNTSSAGSVTIKASGAVVPDSGNYNENITYVDGKLTISVKSISVSGVSLDKDTLTLTVGQSSSLTATVRPSNASNTGVIWSSSDPEIASVSGGTVKALKTGTATITVTTRSGNYSDSCTVTVNPKQYTISYNANGGSGTMNSNKATDGKAFTLPGCRFTPPEGKIFDVWAIGSATGQQVKSGANHTFTENTILYAIWKDAPPVTYTISYDANGGSGSMTSSTVPDKEAFVLPGCRFTAPKGKVFDTWAVGSATGEKIKVGENHIFTADTTLYAIWKDAPVTTTYTISYNANGGSGTMASSTVPDKEAFTLPGCNFTAPEGKIFDVWAIGSATGEKIKVGENHIFTADTTLYAIWKDAPSVTYTITYDANGGSGTMANGITTDGRMFTLPECTFTAPDGKIFDSWAIGSTTGQQVKAGENHIFTENTTLYAIWKDAPSVTYTISYDANGGSGTMANGITTDGKMFTLPGCTFTAPDGKIFDVWAIGSTTGEKIKVGENHIFTENTTLYAIWKDTSSVTYTITYDANGGSNSMTNGTASDGKTFTLPACSFDAPEGKKFDCWAVGSLSGPHMQPGDDYTFTRNTTVYAIWQDLPYDITGIVQQDGRNISGAIVQLKQGATVISEQSTDENGRFVFTKIISGTYNLVAEKDGITVTVMREVVNNSANLTITLPTGKTNSVVEIKNEETPPVIVGDLENVFHDETIYTPEDKTVVEDGGAVEFKLEIEKKEEPATTIEAIKPANQILGLILDLTIMKTVTPKSNPEANTKITKISEVKSLIETIIPLPIALQGKAGYTVYREHDGKAEPLSNSGNGERYEVSRDKTRITIFAQKYSIYAIAYTDGFVITFDANGGTVSQTSAETNSDGKLSGLPVPSQSGYTFQGWYTASGEKVTENTVFAANMTINAHWIKKSSHSGGSSGGSGGGSSGSSSSGSSSKHTSAKKPETPIKETAINPAEIFLDLSENAWYYEAVKYVLSEEIMNGFGNGKFRPDENLSRAQLAQILYNREGRPEQNGKSSFADVNNDKWYTAAIVWANEKEIVNGYSNGSNGLFGPDDFITREQLAVMLWRYAGKPSASDKKLQFNDADETGNFAIKALQWAVDKGIITGYGDGRVNPKGLATRAQVAQMLMRYLKEK